MNGQQMIGLTILPLHLIGIISNLLILSVTLKLRSLSPPFAFLTGCLAFFNLVYSTWFFGYAGPLIVLNIEKLQIYSSVCTYIIQGCYDCNVNIHLVISLNRFFAIFAPIAYKNVFNLFLTKVFAFCCFSFTVINYSVYISYGCRMYYEDEIWMFWIDETDPTCVTWSWILDYAKNLSCAVFNCSLDVVTIVKLQYTRRRGITALVANGVYYLASGLSQNMYITFMLTTFLWGSFTVTDGMTILIYNSEIQNSVLRRKNKTLALTTTT